MMKLVLGVPDSGKSEFAEQLALEAGPADAKRIYIATMIPEGDEGRVRVEKHREKRACKGFLTIECPSQLMTMSETVRVYSPAVCLLECMSNLVGNEMHRPENAEKTPEELADSIARDVTELSLAAEELIVVSNEFDEHDPEYDEETKTYVRLQALVNEHLKRMADQAYLYEDGGFVLHEDL